MAFPGVPVVSCSAVRSAVEPLLRTESLLPSLLLLRPLLLLLFPTFLAVPVAVSVSAVVGFFVVVASLLLLACDEHRSYPYDPIRSKMNVVRFRTIRIVRK